MSLNFCFVAGSEFVCQDVSIKVYNAALKNMLITPLYLH